MDRKRFYRACYVKKGYKERERMKDRERKEESINIGSVRKIENEVIAPPFSNLKISFNIFFQPFFYLSFQILHLRLHTCYCFTNLGQKNLILRTISISNFLED